MAAVVALLLASRPAVSPGACLAAGVRLPSPASDDQLGTHHLEPVAGALHRLECYIQVIEVIDREIDDVVHCRGQPCQDRCRCLRV